jgi:AcrR family transcriptional regulator
MARRTLRNLDQRIIKETIVLGAKQGPVRLNVRTLAKNCGITDTTVYVHFETKKKLLLSAFEYINNSLNEIILKKDKEGASAKEIWIAALEYFISHPNETQYFAAIGHTSNYNAFVINEHNIKYLELFKRHAKGKAADYSEEELLLVWIIGVDATMNLSMFINENKLKYTPRLTDLFFGQIYGKFFD